MKAIYLIIILIFLIISTFDGITQKVEYTYDDAGNRTTQYIIRFGGKETNDEDEDNIKTKSVEEEEQEVFKHNFGEREIHVYPNPTKGLLTIEIWKGNFEENYRLVLYDSSGKLLNTSNIKGNGAAPLDLSLYPSGIYILIIHTADGKSEYKIIKE